MCSHTQLAMQRTLMSTTPSDFPNDLTKAVVSLLSKSKTIKTHMQMVALLVCISSNRDWKRGKLQKAQLNQPRAHMKQYWGDYILQQLPDDKSFPYVCRSSVPLVLEWIIPTQIAVMTMFKSQCLRPTTAASRILMRTCNGTACHQRGRLDKKVKTT